MDDRQLPDADHDPELRLPARGRRWYPLQDGDLILGALRADLDPREDWTAEWMPGCSVPGDQPRSLQRTGMPSVA